MTQRSDPSEARSRGTSVSSQALYRWATALPIYEMKLYVWVSLWTSIYFHTFGIWASSKGSSEAGLSIGACIKNSWAYDHTTTRLAKKVVHVIKFWDIAFIQI